MTDDELLAMERRRTEGLIRIAYTADDLMRSLRLGEKQYGRVIGPPKRTDWQYRIGGLFLSVGVWFRRPK